MLVDPEKVHGATAPALTFLAGSQQFAFAGVNLAIAQYAPGFDRSQTHFIAFFCQPLQGFLCCVETQESIP